MSKNLLKFCAIILLIILFMYAFSASYTSDSVDNISYVIALAIDENEDYTSAYEGRNQAMLENHLKIIDLQEVLLSLSLFNKSSSSSSSPDIFSKDELFSF